MLDSELSNYVHKPVAFAGVSSGRWGGVRAIEALNQTVREMGMVSTFTDVQFPNVATLFDASGDLIEPIYRELVSKAYLELIWMAKTLKWGREHIG
jgi:NAD(P)H-dependent FMN reductase